jgi:hypothetical protein
LYSWAEFLQNPGFVNVPAANTLMAKADVNLDPTARLQEYYQAEQLLVTNVAWIPLNQAKVFFSVPSYVHNFPLGSFGNHADSITYAQHCLCCSREILSSSQSSGLCRREVGRVGPVQAVVRLLPITGR